ncbi:SDR family NAD(P)-dependent oxidoreductase [Gordonia rubripertincta]|uniref:SDR family NAD(P)-dependent oxidoreductase n=1 Tax=Gordonia rubripertincta TaxID=36822 RepID=A0ABT4MVP2_GORRU|nr:SDR family NAD(P)-dependent oxidoreductase [Gordonia rubripertincta]MCZ4551078.1 SDR family NAD(P)-dependent oxidoreductase [Gordonia rubripertincta]
MSDTLVITGAAGDIGSAVAVRMASPSTQMLLLDRDLSRLQSMRSSLLASCADVAILQCDVSSASDAAKYADYAREFGGGSVRWLFNNAGIPGDFGPLTDYSTDTFDRVMAVNVRGVFLGLKHIGPLMGSGAAVVNTSSVGGIAGQANMVAYVASKHAVMGLTKAAALEWADRGVRVNAVCPGPVEGQMMNSIFAGLDLDPRDRAAQVPLRRLATPEDIAASVAFLLNPTAGHVTGTSITVDGGRLAG